MAHLGGGNQGNFVLCHARPWAKNKKHQKLIYFTELSLKTIKNSFLCRNFD
jgi:hypothetical protein